MVHCNLKTILFNKTQGFKELALLLNVKGFLNSEHVSAGVVRGVRWSGKDVSVKLTKGTEPHLTYVCV